MNENAINELNIKILCLKQWNNIKKKNLLRQNYLFHRNLQFQKFTKTKKTPHSGWGNTTHHTLANFNLHQPLISFLYIIPSCKQYWKDVQTWCKVWNHIDTEFGY